MKKLREGHRYAIALQRAIECHCRGLVVPDCVAEECPFHTKILDDNLLYIKQEDNNND